MHSEALHPSLDGGAKAQTSDDEQRMWAAFADPDSAQTFYANWLAILCRGIAGARVGLLLLRREDGRFSPAAIWPSPLWDVTYLSPVAERALSERRGVVQGAPGREADSAPPGVLVGYPVEVGARLHGAIVLDVAAPPGAELASVLRQLHWGAGWIDGLIWRERSEAAEEKLKRVAVALDTLAAAEEHEGFEAAALAFANELAARLNADRVTIGACRRRRGVRLRAMSHSAAFQKKAEVVSAIESAMEEALDQNATIAYPPTEAAKGRLAAMHEQLAEEFGAGHAASVVLRARGRPVGVLTVERRAQAFDGGALELIELVGALLAPSMSLKAEAQRWFSGRLARLTARAFKAVLGPRRPALKLAVLSAAAGIAFLAFAHDDFRVSAKSVLEGSVQRAAVAPFDGYIKEAPVRAGETVREGQLLAQLEERDLRFEQLKWESERQKLLQKHREALAKHDRVGVLVVGAQLRQAEAQLALASEKLARTRILAPIDGVVVSGDLSQMLGSPVEQGKVLFEIAPLGAYRVVVQVDEHDIGYVAVGQTGSLLLTGASSEAIPLQLRKITSVSTPQDGRNFFRVEADLGATALPLRPGMEGVAKVTIDRRPLLWIWTRAIVERARLLLWQWLP